MVHLGHGPGERGRSPIGDSDTSSTTCYRLNSSFRNIGIAGITLSAALGLASVFVAYFNVDNSFTRPLLAATGFGLFWACFVLLGVLLLLLHRRYRLWFNADSVRQRGVFLDRTLELSGVTELKWRRFPTGGSVKLSGADGALKIELGSFAQGQRANLIEHLRNAIPEDRQRDWGQFHRHFEDSTERQVRTRRASRAISLLLAFHAIAFLILWGLRFGNHYLLLALVNTIFLVYFRRGAPNSPSRSVVGEPSDAPQPRS